ncbi:MAG: hypothetical protein ACRDY6_02540 [Acidimicrobiia bacterium]
MEAEFKARHMSSEPVEELARAMIRNEERHVSEIEKMLRRRGEA